MIRKLNQCDIDRVAQIWLEGNTRAHAFIPEKYWTDQYGAVKKTMLRSEVYVYENNGEILGFMGLTHNYMAGIFVSFVAQSRGIGKQLLDYAKGLKTELSLRVYKKNARAVKFYQRENFIIQSENVDENTGAEEFLMLWEQ